MRRFTMAWLWILTVGFAVVFGQPVGAQESGETVEAHGRWVGELQFKRHGQQDVICKIAVSVRNYQIKDGFDCPQVWWLVPGFSWSIVGKVDASGTLASANIMWGKENYAELTGTLRRASGHFSEQISYGTIRSTAGGDAVLALRPEAGATRVGRPGEETDGKGVRVTSTAAANSRYDGTYAGKLTCVSSYSYAPNQFAVESTVSKGRARTKLIEEYLATGSRNQFSSENVVGKDGSVRFEISGGTQIVLRLGEDPPSFESVGLCKEPIKKVAGVPNASSSAEGISIEDAKYNGQSVCMGWAGYDENITLAIKVRSRSANIVMSRTVLLNSTRYERTFDVKIPEDEKREVRLKLGGVEDPIIISFLEDPPTASYDNCQIPLEKHAVGADGSKSVAIEDGTYSGKQVCLSAEGTSMETEASLIVDSDTATFYHHFRHRGGLTTHHKSVNLSETNTISISSYGGNIVVRLNERPLVAEVVGNCKIGLNKTASAPIENTGAKAVKFSDGEYSGKSVCKSSSGFDYLMNFVIYVQDKRAKIVVTAEDIRSAAREERVFDVKLGEGGVTRTNLELGRPHDPIEVSFLTDPPTVVYDICDISMRSTEK